MRGSRFFLLAWLLFAGYGWCGEPEAVFKVPHGKDETSLVAIKANTRKYVGAKLILCGGVKIGSFYGYPYTNSGDTYYALEFSEAGEDSATPTGESADLYLPKKIGADLIESIVKFQSEQQKHGGAAYQLIRVRVTVRPDAYARDQEWKTMEMLDWQLSKKDDSGWQPWAVESERDKKDEEASAAAKVAYEQSAKRAAAKVAEEAAAEAAKWRMWTASTGTKIEAKFGGMSFGKVKLIKRDGSSVQLPLDDLSDADREWIKNRKR
jgi:SLA1 homology domain 1, SHD1